MEQNNPTLKVSAVPVEISSKLSKNKNLQYADIRNKTITAGIQFYKAIKQLEDWKLVLNDEQKKAAEFIFGEVLETMPLNYKHAYLLKRIGDVKNIKSLTYRTFNFFQDMAGKVEVRGYDNAMKLYDAIHAFEENMQDLDMLTKQQQQAAKIFQAINTEYGKFCNDNHVMPEDLEELTHGIVFSETETTK